jgi:hypothetical protein
MILPRSSVSPSPSWLATPEGDNRPDLRQGTLEREVVDMLAEEFADAALAGAGGGPFSQRAGDSEF